MKKRASCLVLGLFLFVAIAQGQEEERKWAGRAVPKGAPKPIKALAAAPTCPILCDPLGDHFTSAGNPIVDIVCVKAGSDCTKVTFKICFSANTVMKEVVGFIDLDTDQSGPGPPIPHANIFCPGAMQDIGYDFFLDLFTHGIARVWDAKGNLQCTVPTIICGQMLEVTVPLSCLGSDDGCMDVGMVLGNKPQPTDCAPQKGHGTVRRCCICKKKCKKKHRFFTRRAWRTRSRCWR